MSERIPVNPAVLRWARETAGMAMGEAAERMSKDVAEIAAWEAGDAAPTYVQLEKLAYTVYRRPIALFFFPEPPEEEGIRQSFRTLPETELARIPSKIRYLLRKAKRLQINLAELYDGENPAEQNITRELAFRPGEKAAVMARNVRAYLGIDLREQQRWRNSDVALRHWRDALTEHGVFVFKDSFRSTSRSDEDATAEADYSGFCVYDALFPIVYVNNNMSKTRQIFTLFHELAHILLRTGGIDTLDDTYIAELRGDARKIEVLCNAFASEFLLPEADFAPRTANATVESDTIAEWALLYSVSREVVLRRLLDRGRVDQGYYEARVEEWRHERRPQRAGGDYYRTKGAYLGPRYVGLVFSQYHQHRITLEEAADYLDEKAKNLAGMEDWLSSQSSVA